MTHSQALSAAALTAGKVLLHIALSGAITAVVVYLSHDASLVFLYPAINVAEAAVLKYLNGVLGALPTPPPAS